MHKAAIALLEIEIIIIIYIFINECFKKIRVRENTK